MNSTQVKEFGKLLTKLNVNGYVEISTDHQPYTDMVRVYATKDGIDNCVGIIFKNGSVQMNVQLPKEPVKVWQYEDCPEEYKKVIEDPSDLDWVIFVPNSYYYESANEEQQPIWLSFLNTNWRDPKEIIFEDGSKLLLMYHS